MNNNTLRKAVLAGLALTLLSPAVRAQTAIVELASLAGSDASPMIEHLKVAKASAQRPLTIPLNAKDILEGCSALEVKNIMPMTPKQGALLVQTCLNHYYPADGQVQVQAQAARFGVRSCPEATAGSFSCEAFREVEGIKITVSGLIMTGSPVLLDLNYTVKKRNGKVLGFDTIVENDATIAR